MIVSSNTMKRAIASKRAFSRLTVYSIKFIWNQRLTILVFVAFSGITKRSQNSRISCILPVISIPPSPSPVDSYHDIKIT